MKRIAIFASGAGSNAQKIIDYFRTNSSEIAVSLIVSNNPQAGVLDIANENKINIVIVNKEELKNPNRLIETLEKEKIDLIVLAGFLLLIPQEIINKFKNKIINIHPALLPKYGGKGMYGSSVHKAVKLAGEKETGITIHFVDEKFDQGEIIFQVKSKIEQKDTIESIAKKVQMLEHIHYPRIIESLLNK
ncbi:MAG: phosphoribosylglycinamide formyltransferase [Bacteroidota bacterium]|nr:phosphoribosylglycinamide formyltransferase [Bacteroidota bacterium]